MTKVTPMYALGDKIVHRSYGVGKIDSVEKKPINGIEVECFKVKTENCDYWFPTDSFDNPRIHPVASKELLNRAIEILRSPPREFENDPIEWKERTDKVLAGWDLLAISELVRDLSILRTQKNLDRSLTKALKTLEDRLLREWAASSDENVSSIQQKIQNYLKKGN
jgi:RNA polymerase-interacting CarD/CdnL/TRCF family regulator